MEKYKQNDLLQQVLAEMAGEYPTLTRVLVHERDLYMAMYARMVLRNMTLRKFDQFRRLRQQQADGAGRSWVGQRGTSEDKFESSFV